MHLNYYSNSGDLWFHLHMYIGKGIPIRFYDLNEVELETSSSAMWISTRCHPTIRVIGHITIPPVSGSSFYTFHSVIDGNGTASKTKWFMQRENSMENVIWMLYPFSISPSSNTHTKFSTIKNAFMRCLSQCRLIMQFYNSFGITPTRAPKYFILL